MEKWSPGHTKASVSVGCQCDVRAEGLGYEAPHATTFAYAETDAVFRGLAEGRASRQAIAAAAPAGLRTRASLHAHDGSSSALRATSCYCCNLVQLANDALDLVWRESTFAPLLRRTQVRL